MHQGPLITILVEDSQTIRDTLVPALEELANANVVAMAATAKEAMHAIATWNGHWELVIIDLFLAAGTGLDVLQGVQDRSIKQHALVLSNYATIEMRRQCIALGADGVYDKSTELDAFFERCDELLATRQA